MSTAQKIDKQTALRMLDALERRSREPGHRAFDSMRLMIERIFDPTTPSSTLSMKAVNLATTNMALLAPEDRHESFIVGPAGTKGFAAQLNAVLHGMGHRELRGVLTSQEHKLAGSSLAVSDPYMPIGIAQGEMGIDEVNVARRLIGVVTALDAYFDVSERPDIMFDEVSVRISLEPVGADGRTVCDPRVVQIINDKVVVVTPEIEQSADFPYSRKRG